MFIPAFWVGVVATFLFEIVVGIIITIVTNIKDNKKRRKNCNDKCDCNHNKSK